MDKEFDAAATIRVLAEMAAQACNWRVLWFASEMQRVLTYNRTICGKSGWETMSDKQILHRIRQETAELTKAVEDGATPQEMIAESVDIANFALFFAARYHEHGGQS